MTAGALLHARSRGLYPTAGGLAALGIGAPLVTRWLDEQWGLDRFVLLDIWLLSALAGVTLISSGLAGADPELEASTARAGTPLRLAQITIGLLAVESVLLLGFWVLLPFANSHFFLWRQSVILAEGVAVLLGVVAVAATVLGARLSWAPAALWVILLLGSDGDTHGWKRIGQLPKSTPQEPFYAYAAVVVAVIGLGAYVSRRISR